MRKSIFIVATTAVAIITTVMSCSEPKSTVPVTAVINKDSIIKKGEYLVTIGGCDDCHSPKKMGPRGPELVMELRFSGYPADRPLPPYDSNVVNKGLVMMNGDLTSAAGPWGASFASNITSDETGLGNWTEERFFKAVREGKSKGLDNNRPLMPPMPWQNISKMKDEDLKAIFAYLKSTKPVRNLVPDPRPLTALK